MPLRGDYAPSKSAFARRQAERYEATGGDEEGTLSGKPIIVLTTVGAKSGKLRKTALMRVEHEGRYAVVASRGGAAKHPQWFFNLLENPHVELQDGPAKRDYLAHEAVGAEKAEWWPRAVGCGPHMTRTRRRRADRFPCSSWIRCETTEAPDRRGAPGNREGCPEGCAGPGWPRYSTARRVANRGGFHRWNVVCARGWS